MQYWLIRAKWGTEDKKADFIKNDEWINGYEDKYFSVVNRVLVGDVLLLADASTITHYGECIQNDEDGRHLFVEKWIEFKESFNFLAVGADVKIIAKVSDEDLIKKVNRAIEQTTSSKNIKIRSIDIENFTVFKNEHLDFSNGLNIIIGENGTGKSHLLKLLYALIESNNIISTQGIGGKSDKIRYLLQTTIPEKLKNIFKPDELSNLILHDKDTSRVLINLSKYSIEFDFSKNTKVEVNIKKESTPKELFEKGCVFIPAKEILSFFEGFTSLYEKRGISFDEVYYNLAQSLGLQTLKNIDASPKEKEILDKLEEILEGEIVLERGRFYLITQGNKKTEITLIAEGLKKIGTISYLLANGSLDRNSILFWDEPESNLNPRLIKKIAKIFFALTDAGVQIFVATHSLFLVKEIEILRTRDAEVKYFGLEKGANGIIVSQDENFESLSDLVLLDEELEQSDRFSEKLEV